MRRLAPLLLPALLLAACDRQPPIPAAFTLQGELVPQGELALAAVATPAANAPLSGSAWGLEHTPGVLLVDAAAQPELSAQALSRQLAALGARELAPGLHRLAVTPGREREAALELAARGVRAQPNFVYRPLAAWQGALPPNDPGFPGNAGVAVAGAPRTQTYLERIRAPQAWALLRGTRLTRGAAVALLDTGVSEHPELAGRLLPGRNFCLQNLPEPTLDRACEGESDDTRDSFDHGTGVAGVVSALSNNGVGIAGIAAADLLPVRVVGAGGLADTVSIRRGLDHAGERGARVVNLSLGFPLFSRRGEPYPYDPAVREALGRLQAGGALVVAAAGNDPNQGIFFPASEPGVLAVGAFGVGDAPASFSARPREGQRGVDLYAPGVELLVLSNSGGYRLQGGTSFAAPQVSAAASLLWALRPELSAAQVRELLIASATSTPGGPLLNVEAALRALPAFSGPRAYRYTVQACRAGECRVAEGVTQGGERTVPFAVAGLSAGTYTVQATVEGGGVRYAGSLTVTVPTPGRVSVPVSRQ